MPKMNIADAAKYFGVSKEAIHNRIRRGSLESIMVGSEKHVIIDDTKINVKSTTKVNTKKINSQNDDKYHKYLETQNEQLQAKIDKLEGETRSLRDQKEQMLIQERQKIEQIYKDKDEQLKNILNAISSKFMLEAPSEHLEAEIEVNEVNEENFDIEDTGTKVSRLEESSLKSSSDSKSAKLTPLNKYLKQRDFSKKKRDKIKTRFDKNYKNDKRITRVNKKYYIDLDKYDYSDYSL